jgi:CBS domain-containing protein
MLAKDIMTWNPITVNAEAKIEEVSKILVEKKISGLPVVDDEDRLIGIISEKDMMAKAAELKIPFYVTLFESIIFLENPVRFNNELKKYTAYRVKDAMTTKVISVEENAPMAEVVELLQKKNINRLPVLRNHKVIGIITRNDVLKAINSTI